MVNPLKVTNFERTESELQEFLLFCIVVAGKSSFQQTKKLEDFLLNDDAKTPFQQIRFLNILGILEQRLKGVRMGQYTRISNAFLSVSSYQGTLKTITLKELEPLVGMKTSRFFLVHSRPNQQHAILDRHVLAWMKKLGYDVPKNTPSSKTQYAKLEKLYLSLLKEFGIKHEDAASFDLHIWASRAIKNKVLTK